MEPMVSKDDGHIVWCDVYKGIAICLVVLGHATGYFNQYIYQFHMAAFFLIYGYTSNFRKYSFSHFFIEKVYRFLVPYYVLSVAGVIIYWILDKFNWLHYISKLDFENTSLVQAIKDIFISNYVRCEWCGAMWFLPVLFLGVIISRVILNSVRHNNILAMGISVVIFIIAEVRLCSGHLDNLVSLGAAAQFFIISGYSLRKFDFSKLRALFLVLASIITIILWKLSIMYITNATVDWPSLQFNGIKDIYLPVYGITLLIFLSIIISSNAILSKVFCVLGQNSMGIMCFHFLGFKLAFLILYSCGSVSIMQLQELVPKEAGVVVSCGVIFPISLLFSLCVWWVIKKFRVTSFLVGNAKLMTIRQVILNQPIGKKVFKCYYRLEKLIEKAKKSYLEFLGKGRRKPIIITIVVILLLFICFPALKNTITIYVDKDTILSFPQGTHPRAKYGSGWLEQSESESYRWVMKDSNMNVLLRNQTKLVIKGYIPENVQNMTFLSVQINDIEIYRAEATANMLINIEVDISGYVQKNQENSISLHMDGERVPDENELDQRRFSALIQEIIIN